MEALLFIFDTAAVALLCYMSLMDDRKKPTETLTSLFRFKADGGMREPAQIVPTAVKDKKLKRLQRKYAR